MLTKATVYYCNCRLKDPSGEFEYEMPFDVNTQDVTDQNILYISSVLGNFKIIELLLNYKVKARNVKETESGSQPVSVSKKRISSGIQRLMSSLNFRGRYIEKKDENLMCPLNLDLYCNNNMETALHVAVKGRYTDIVAALLQVRSDFSFFFILKINFQNSHVFAINIVVGISKANKNGY